jgi:EmrB/QacA subfamily drug resistance transporter
MQVSLSRLRSGGTSGEGVPATRVALAALCTILFLTFLDNTIVSVGLGSMQSDLSASVADLQWVIGAYALTFAAIMLACGMIGDELGRKKVMLAGVGVFCAGSIMCGVATTPQVLIAGRAIMGLGAAASEPGTLSVLRQIYTDDRARSRAVGIWAGVSGLALALGPVIGGLLVGVWNWRGIFWFNLAFGLAALVVAALVVPESSDPRAARVDIAGTVLGAGALGALIAGVIDAETNGFGAPRVIAFLCAAVVLAIAFVMWERRAAYPLLDLKFFRIPQFATSNVVALVSYFATFAIFFFTALYLVVVVSASGYRIALVFLPMTVLMIIASVLAGRWTAGLGPRWPITAGCVIFGGGLLLSNAFIGAHPDYVPLSISLALAGVGIGLTVVPVTTAVLNAVPPERSGMAASAANTSREIGAVLGTSVLGALVFSQLSANLSAELQQNNVPLALKPLIVTALETGQTGLVTQYAQLGPIIQRAENAAFGAFTTGLHAALYLSAGLVLLAAVLAAVTLRDPAGKTSVTLEGSRP